MKGVLQKIIEIKDYTDTMGRKKCDWDGEAVDMEILEDVKVVYKL